MAGTDWPFTMLGRQFFDGTLPSLVREIKRLADELKRYNDGQMGDFEEEQPENAKAYIKAAQARWGSPQELAVDDDAKVSTGYDNGAFVQAWVWVCNEDLEGD